VPQNEPPTTITLGERIRAFRASMGLSREDLAGKLGVTPITILRWENGSSRPRAHSARCLEELGLGPIARHDTKDHSTPRSVQLDRKALRAEIRDSIVINGASLEFEPAPYVLNGPADQLAFYETLFDLQEHRDARAPMETASRRLSCVESVGGRATAQAQLENRKPDAKSWDGNYGPHGWHRYVGRFPPHLVRALLNHFDVRQGDVICDPFAGSGTTLVEARLLGLNAIGIDLCPLSCTLSRTKATFPRDSSELRASWTEMSNEFVDTVGAWRSDHPDPSHQDVMARDGNPVEPFANIEKWFTPQALLGTSIAVELIMRRNGYARDFFATALSAEMRSIGNVDVDVVRAEYRKTPREGVDVHHLMQRRVKKMLRLIDETVESHGDLLSPAESIDVREQSMLSTKIEEGSIDSIVTSPPYGVESLSYLRTHLLSYRSLQPHLNYDPYHNSSELVGSEYLDNEAEEAGDTVRPHSPVFRTFFDQDFGVTDHRRVAMMERFFDDMLVVAMQFKSWLRPGGRAAFVVGNKRLGDHIIPTDEIVTELFQSCGLRLDRSVQHKLKTNNSNSEVPWQERIIQQEAVLLFSKV
jgi:tRNA G10  N-methylase Trm11/transcriptional regulator with XRE-family HTH domain